MLAQLAALSLLASSGQPVGWPDASSRTRIEVWTNRGDDAYASGQGARVFFRSEVDAYVTVLRVDTDGRVRVLFPLEPWEDNFARGGREYEIQGGYERDAFSIDDYPGVGYIFAVAATDPFVYDAFETGDHWDYRAIADGRVHGDPYVALTDLAQRILPADFRDWDYDITPYYVNRHYDYPRFLCYDCHTYVSYPLWSVYDYTCVRFRIVVFDDPYYYPYRYYGGTRVVFTRPYRPEPRFSFKDRSRTDVFVTRVAQRPANDDRRREVGVSGRDLGGIGIIPPPRRRPDVTGGTGDERERRGEPGNDDRHRRQPDRPDRPDRPDNPGTPDRGDAGERRDRADRRDRPERQDRSALSVSPEVRAPRRERGQPESRPQVESRAPERSPRAQPAPPPPRSEPRALPKRDAPKDKPQRSDPELRRRKP